MFSPKYNVGTSPDVDPRARYPVADSFEGSGTATLVMTYPMRDAVIINDSEDEDLHMSVIGIDGGYFNWTLKPGESSDERYVHFKQIELVATGAHWRVIVRSDQLR